MNKQHFGTVQCITPLATDIFKVSIKLEKMPEIKPGQFLNVKIPGFTLRRPFGISGFDTTNKTVNFCFQIRGAGTEALAKITNGTRLDLLLPLGNGFPHNKYKKIMLIGGGIGVFPLLPTAANSYAFLGFRNNKSILLEEDFRKTAKQVTIVTDGYVTDVARKHLDEIKPDAVFACGPLVMFKAMKQTFANVDIPVYISMEERMACGFGACICCTVDTTDSSNDTNKAMSSHSNTNTTSTGKSRVCCDGPVFLLNEVIL